MSKRSNELFDATCTHVSILAPCLQQGSAAHAREIAHAARKDLLRYKFHETHATYKQLSNLTCLALISKHAGTKHISLKLVFEWA